MKLYRRKYDGTEEVSATIERILTDADCRSHKLLGSATRGEMTLNSSNASADWCELLSHNPKFYLRLTLSLDLSFSRGKFPTDSDFPAELRLAQLEERVLEPESFPPQITITPDMEIAEIQPPPTWSGSDRSPSRLTHPVKESRVNLEFADLFDTQQNDEDRSRDWIEEVTGLFDCHIPG